MSAHSDYGVYFLMPLSIKSASSFKTKHYKSIM